MEAMGSSIPVRGNSRRMRLYSMTYKPRGNKPMGTGFIEASSLDSALILGRRWCEEHECRYVNMLEMVLAREE